ncbi:MAG: hypothetical protein IJU76_14480 [Desulfovibrionaceae bacterium]|nr:hypothetical protein [Desulfovibrionaceae bacterium]
MSNESAQNMLTETSYKTEAWQYRHAVVKAIIIFFSIFFLLVRALWGALAGFYNGVVNGWNEIVVPFMTEKIERPAHDESNGVSKPQNS